MASPSKKSELRLSKPPEHPKSCWSCWPLRRRPQKTPEDKAYIDAIVEVVLEREERHPTGLLPDPEQAWEEFSAVL